MFFLVAVISSFSVQTFSVKRVQINKSLYLKQFHIISNTLEFCIGFRGCFRCGFRSGERRVGCVNYPGENPISGQYAVGPGELERRAQFLWNQSVTLSKRLGAHVPVYLGWSLYQQSYVTCNSAVGVGTRKPASAYNTMPSSKVEPSGKYLRFLKVILKFLKLGRVILTEASYFWHDLLPRH